MNIALKKSSKSKIALLIFTIIFSVLLSNIANAATSIAVLNTGSNSAKGTPISITDGTSKMTVTNGSNQPFQLIGHAKKFNVSIIPDTIVHTSYARPQTEVVSTFYPTPTSYYAVAYTEYNTTQIWGAVQITD
ncbi:hypothetical protein [Bacillus ndiopicus]|uniref:hypothetical protein n=1 Tax=Bacillus ndiopicus TaxID=1347368 RepID=UPI0005A91FA6|nr:hypothetical protein [Bacillus ndiopicus]